jgi:putative flippase GtrA
MLGTLKKLFFSAQFGKFLLVGGLAATLQWLSRFAFDLYFSYSLSVVLAFGIGVTSGFLLNRAIVFQSTKGNGTNQLASYILINLAGLPLIWWISIMLGEKLLPQFMPSETAKALGNGIGILSPVFINFILHKFITFQTSQR